MIHSLILQKNNKDITDFLDSIGIKRSDTYSETYPVIVTYFEDNVPMYTSCEYPRINEYVSYDAINCSTNSDMFYALVALSDTTDYMQWFTDGKDWEICLYESYDKTWRDNFKKANIKEICDYFKDILHIIIYQCYEDIQDIHVFKSYNDAVDFVYDEYCKYHDNSYTKTEVDYHFRKTRWFDGYSYYTKHFNE